MIAQAKIDLESFHELALAHTHALSEALEAMQEAQHQYRLLRSATKRLLNCPALNTEGLEDEDIDAISKADMILSMAKQLGLVADDEKEG